MRGTSDPMYRTMRVAMEGGKPVDLDERTICQLQLPQVSKHGDVARQELSQCIVSGTSH